MTDRANGDGSANSWLLALAALTVCGPWPGWEPPLWAVAVTVAGLLWLAKPKGRGWWAWPALIPALAAIAWAPGRPVAVDRLERQLDDHCLGMLRTAERVIADPDLRRLIAPSGEAADPRLPFRVLERQVDGRRGRTIYLADDRSRLVAWGGEERAFPIGVRALGERRWGVVWSAGGAVLYLREPLMVEGRLVGAITVADATTLEAPRLWGMSPPRGYRMVVGQHAPEATMVVATSAPGVEVTVGWREAPPRLFGLRWLAWLGLAVAALAMAPSVAWLVVLVGASSYLVAAGEAPQLGLATLLLLAGAAIGRVVRRLPSRWARMAVPLAVAAAATASMLAAGSELATWLPDRLLSPGWGGVWMVALAWVVSGWPTGVGGEQPSLARRVLLATFLALLGLALDAARIPVELAKAGRSPAGVKLPRGEIVIERELPVPLASCRLDDLAPVLARRWGLDEWRTPSQLRLVDSAGFELSRWGDLTPAGDNLRLMRSWDLPDGASLELDVATAPWSLLQDWRSGAAREVARAGRLWFAVLTRSGSKAASLHTEIADVDAITAGELYHSGGGWTRLKVDGAPAASRVLRRDEWLVAAVARYPTPAVWVLRAAVASLWALLGLLLARPPTFRRGQLATFGGRLRLLVAGGVVLPLVVLTLVLNVRLHQEERRLEQVLGLDALEAARYTASHLSGGFEVDDEIARWLSAGWGGEVVLFEGAEVVAVSRPDLMSAGVLPQLPAAAVFPAYLTGRDEPSVLRRGDRVVAAGPVELQGRRLLLELIRIDPLKSRDTLGAVDWLLTGALLAALLALVLTSRVERRLSVSLRDLVSLARRLLHGEPVGEVRRPVETDLAEVLDAVRSMNEEVQQRELSLRHQEELLRITLSTLAPAVVVLQPDGELRFANPSAEQLQKVHGDLLLEVVRDVAGGEGPEAAATVETVQPVPGQDLTWRVGVAGVPLPDGSRGLVAVLDDVTDVVRIDRLRQLNQLARIVAHEVKNPLTPVRLWVQELEEARRRDDPRLGELLKEACREISIQVDRLQTTANSFSNLVALERWEAEVVDLAELVAETLDGLSILRRRGIRLVQEQPDGEACRVRGDRQWLQRALGNLLKNSVDALGEQQGEVYVRLGCNDDVVTVEVEDTAGGIPNGQLEELFSPHFSTTTAGSGLGLALVLQVVARCQGRVSAANCDRGLLVRLELPRAE